jgi:RHS repeat-associated protein
METRYFHSDGLGSITTVTDEIGRVVKRFAFDAWGKRVDPTTNATIVAATNTEAGSSTSGKFTRGYTDHEHLDDLGLIHMNGRVYDPVLGRLLSADPYVQDLGNSQSHNRYSYCVNNPLNATDPSGYNFLKKWGGQILGVIVAVVVTVVTLNPYLGGLAGGFVSGFAGSLLNGGSIGDAFKAGVLGGAIGLATAGAGQIGNGFLRLAASGVVGGLASEAMGGDFRSGFFSGLATAALAPSIGAAAKQNWYAGMIVSAVVGGTASVIGGGKFANGAAFGAFQYVVSNVPTRTQLESSPLAGAGIAGKMMIDRVIGENFGAAWRSMLTEKWVNGPTGGKLPESLANGMMDVVRSAPADAAANGMHAWHAGSNAYLAGKLGLIGAPALIAGGLFHESPMDWRSFMAEQSGVPDPATGVRQGGQGTVNHILDSTMDIVANVFGMVSGYANPGFVNFAVKWGNYIPGPGDPDPTMPGGGGGTHQYTGDPRAAWGPGPVKSW